MTKNIDEKIESCKRCFSWSDLESSMKCVIFTAPPEQCRTCVGNPYYSDNFKGFSEREYLEAFEINDDS
jgi:hypothetical protein